MTDRLRRRQIRAALSVAREGVETAIGLVAILALAIAALAVGLALGLA